MKTGSQDRTHQLYGRQTFEGECMESGAWKYAIGKNTGGGKYNGDRTKVKSRDPLDVQVRTQRTEEPGSVKLYKTATKWVTHVNERTGKKGRYLAVSRHRRILQGKNNFRIRYNEGENVWP